MNNDTVQAREAGSAHAKGHNEAGDPWVAHGTFDPSDDAEAGDDGDESSESAIVVPGRYVAEVLCPTLPNHVRRALSQLREQVGVDELVALGLIGEVQRPSEGDVHDWCMRTLHTAHDWYAKPLPLEVLRGVTTGYDPRREVALATLLPLVEAEVPWATTAVDWMRDANTVARREPVLTLAVADLIALGVGLADAAALPSADVHTRAMSARVVNTWAEAERLERRREAMRMEAERAAADVSIPARVDLGSYQPEAVRWTVEGLVARGAVLGLFAERKAGKTTVVCELVRAVLHGERFLGRFAVRAPEDAEVVLFDTEMPIGSLHAQYHRAGVQHLDRLNLRTLRGVERSLDVRVEAVRTRWREVIAPGSLIVVDCLYSLFGALGVSESSDEVVEVLAGLRTLATECEASGLVIVHHLGKDTERGARGHSSIEGFPDAIARIELDGSPSADTPRTFSAYGRDDVSVEPGVLTLDGNHRLALGGNPTAERTAKRQRLDNLAVRNLIDANPGLSARALGTLPAHERGKLSRDRIRDAIERLALINAIVNKGSNAAPEWHAIDGVDPFATPPRTGE